MKSLLSNATKRIITTSAVCAVALVAEPAETAPPANAPATLVAWEEIHARWNGHPWQEIEAAAEQGDYTAQHYLGRSLAGGREQKMDLAKSVQWYRRAAKTGLATAQNDLGRAYLSGSGVKADVDEAIRWFQAAADQGMELAKRNLAIALARKDTSTERCSAARTALETAARQGDVEAMVQLADFLLHPPGGGQPEGMNALHWLLKAHDRGRKGICSQIGWIYGEPVARFTDEEMAVNWFRLGSREGDSYCELSLGWMLVTGRGVERNAEDGIAWMKKAADKGNPAAQRNLGRVYEQAEPDLWTGQPPDYVHAEKWYRLAADKGDAEAAYRLGRLALEAHIKASRSEAVNWLRTAADQGHLRAAARLKELKETN